MTDHVLSTLVLAVTQASFDLVELAHRLVEGVNLVSLLHSDHKVRVQAHLLNGLDQVGALLHDSVVDLDATLLVGVHILGLGYLLRRAALLLGCKEGWAHFGEVLTRATVHPVVVFFRLGTA